MAEHRTGGGVLLALQDREEFRAAAYLDQGGEPTIGFGHLLLKKEIESGDFGQIERNSDGEWEIKSTIPISEAVGHQLFRQDVAKAERAVNENITTPITQNMFDGLVHFAFNIGGHAFSHSTAARKVNEGKAREVPAAIRLFDKFTNTKGKLEFSQGLANRREDEVLMFLGRHPAQRIPRLREQKEQIETAEEPTPPPFRAPQFQGPPHNLSNFGAP